MGFGSEMEARLDASQSPPVRRLWDGLGPPLRRAEALRLDLQDVVPEPDSASSHVAALADAARPRGARSPATLAYVAAIAAAARADDSDGGGRLLGHLYCRYFADLFGGQALAAPYRWALALPVAAPRHYDFGDFGARRREGIESIYVALNEAGELLGQGVDGEGDGAREAVVAEARRAFELNVHVYAEEGALYSDGARGVANVALGFVQAQLAAPWRAFGYRSSHLEARQQRK